VSFADDVVNVLKKPPYDDAPAAPEAARNEAGAIAKRALATYNQDPRGAGPTAALPVYLEALDLDPSCKLAYEGIAKLVLGRANDSRPAVEAALTFVDVGAKRLPQDADLKDLQKKLRAYLPAKPAEPALARTASSTRNARASSSARIQTGKPQLRCEYCKSPIPAGSDTCRSCEMSGEVQRPAGVVEKARGPMPVLVVVVLVLVAIVGALLVMKRH
jgi:hypothetical protein